MPDTDQISVEQLAEEMNEHYTRVCQCEWTDDDFTRTSTSAGCVLHGGFPDPLPALLARLSAAEQERRVTENDRHLKAQLMERYVDDLAAAEARVETAEQALRFYAAEATYEESTEPHPTRFASGVVPIEADRGSVARAALALQEEGRDAG